MHVLSNREICKPRSPELNEDMVLPLKQLAWCYLMIEPLDHAFACDKDELEVHRSSVIGCQFR